MRTFIHTLLRFTGSAALTGGYSVLVIYILAAVAAMLGVSPWVGVPIQIALVVWALWVAQRVEYEKAVGWTLKNITEAETALLDELRASFSPAACTELDRFVAKRGADSDAAMKRVLERLRREQEAAE